MVAPPFVKLFATCMIAGSLPQKSTSSHDAPRPCTAFNLTSFSCKLQSSRPHLLCPSSLSHFFTHIHTCSFTCSFSFTCFEDYKTINYARYSRWLSSTKTASSPCRRSPYTSQRCLSSAVRPINTRTALSKSPRVDHLLLAQPANLPSQQVLRHPCPSQQPPCTRLTKQRRPETRRHCAPWV